MQPGVVYTTFHFPSLGRERDHDREFGLGDELPRVQGHGGAGHARLAAVGLAETLPRIQRRQQELLDKVNEPVATQAP